MAIEFVEEQSTGITNWVAVQEWVVACTALHKKKVGDLTFVWMDDESLLKVNIEHLNHDFYTDVITFDDSELDTISGDILMSVDRIKDNAKLLNTSYLEELHRVIIHGVLHLCGFGDKSEKEAARMRELENECLKLIQL